MRTAKFIAIIGFALQSSAVNAAFVNITIENENALFANHPNQTVRNAWNALGGSLDVYRVYANFESNTPLDHVHSVFGSPSMPAAMSSSNGAFWNFISTNPKGGIDHWDWPESPGIYTVIPQLAWDTFPTIGFSPSMNQTGGGGLSGPAPGDHFQFNWFSTLISWQHATSFPGNGDAVPGGPSGYRVGLFQATVAAGVDITGQFAIDTGFGIFWGDNTSFTTIPAPGVLVLMSLIFAKPRARRRSYDVR